MIERWLSVDDGPGEYRQVVRRTVLARRIQTVHGFKMGIAQIQLFNVIIHHVHELRLPTRHVIGQRHTSVVAGIDNQAAAKVTHRNLLARLQEHQRGAVKNRIPLGPGILTDRDHIVRGDAMAVDSAIHHVAGHQLGEAGWIALLMFVARR